MLASYRYAFGVNFLEFLSATIGQLVWPLLVVGFVVIFKKQVKQLLGSSRLRHVSAGPSGFKMEFRDELDRAEDDIRESTKDDHFDPDDSEKVIVRDFLAEMDRLGEVSPRAVVMETHARLEKVLRDVLPTATKPGQGRTPGMTGLTRAAITQDLITQQEASALSELTYLRNRIAHEPDHVITAQDARRYAELSMRIAISLRLGSGQVNEGEPPL